MSNKNIFIPGWGFKSSIWHNFNGINLDFPDMTPLNLITVVMHMAKQIPPKSTIIGWSLGGLFAIKLATLFPAKVNKLVLIATTPCFRAGSNWPGITKAQQDIAFLTEHFLRLVSYPNKSTVIKCWLKQNLANIKQQQDLWREYLKILFNSDLRNDYSAISMPILHILGKQDAIIKTNINNLASINNKAQIITIKRAGHALFLTHREIFMQIIKEFLHHAI